MPRSERLRPQSFPRADLAGLGTANGSPPLEWVLASPAYRESTAPLTIPLGQDCAGTAWVTDLTRLPHLWVTGARGTGRSTFLRAAVTTLAWRCPPTELQLFLYGSDPCVFAPFSGLPHLATSSAADKDAAIAALQWMCHELRRRYAIFAAAEVRNITAYNAKPTQAADTLFPCAFELPRSLPQVVAVLDGYSDLLQYARRDVEHWAEQMSFAGRAAGLHAIVASDDLSQAGGLGRLAAYVPAGLTFRLPTRVASAVMIGRPGAEDLTDPGEAMFTAYGPLTELSLRTPIVTEKQIEEACSARK